MGSMSGQGRRTDREISQELLETLAGKHLDREIKRRQETGFDGELILKLVYRDGRLMEVHSDDHVKVTGQSLRGRPV